MESRGVYVLRDSRGLYVSGVYKSGDPIFDAKFKQALEYGSKLAAHNAKVRYSTRRKLKVYEVYLKETETE